MSDAAHVPELDDAPANPRGWLFVIAAFALMVPGVFIALSGADLSDPLKAVAYGIAIVGAAFLLSWAAEVVQLDFSQGLALGLLALFAILPVFVVVGCYA